jgi:hypothetical protein
VPQNCFLQVYPGIHFTCLKDIGVHLEFFKNARKFTEYQEKIIDFTEIYGKIVIQTNRSRRTKKCLERV